MMHLRICSTVSWFSSLSSETQHSHILTTQMKKKNEKKNTVIKIPIGKQIEATNQLKPVEVV